MTLPPRREDLELTDLPEELLVYDPQGDRALCLNRTAGEVLRACDGRTPAAEVLERLGEDPAREDLVQLTLEELGAEGLLAAPIPKKTRREVLGLLVALPLITSFPIPSALPVMSP